MIIAVDHGNSSIKTLHSTFPTALEKHTNKPPLASDILEFGGAHWTMSGQRIPYMMDKTKDDRFFILTLFAIAKELQFFGGLPPLTEINLAVGLPPEHFALHRERFTQYFKREAVSFFFNDLPVSVLIKNVFVYPQAYAAVVPQSTRLRDEPRIFVIDIGGLTIDVLLLKSSVPDLQFCRSFETGVITLTNSVIGKVNSKHGIKLAEEQVVSAIRGDRNLVLPHGVIDDIMSYAKQHADTILDELRENMVELKANPAIFIGGGSILFKKFIEKSTMIVKADFIMDERANAIGYSILATRQLRKTAV